MKEPESKGRVKRGVHVGLSLEKFADAKVSTYDKRAVLKDKANKKLQRLNKFNKLKKRLEAEGRLTGIEPKNIEDEDVGNKAPRAPKESSTGGTEEPDEQDEDKPKERADKARRDPRSRIHKLAEKVQEEKEEAQIAREEAMRQRAERQAKIDEAKARRQKEKSQFFKRTKHGQPVMKYRIDKILETLQSKQ